MKHKTTDSDKVGLSSNSKVKYLDTFSDLSEKARISEFQSLLVDFFSLGKKGIIKYRFFCLGTTIFIGCSFLMVILIISLPYQIKAPTPIAESATPTNTVSPTSTVTPIKTPTLIVKGCVGKYELRIRSGPGKEFVVLGGVKPGDCFEFDGRSDDFLWLHGDFGETEGWLAVEFLVTDSDFSNLPIISK